MLPVPQLPLSPGVDESSRAGLPAGAEEKRKTEVQRMTAIVSRITENLSDFAARCDATSWGEVIELIDQRRSSGKTQALITEAVKLSTASRRRGLIITERFMLSNTRHLLTSAGVPVECNLRTAEFGFQNGSVIQWVARHDRDGRELKVIWPERVAGLRFDWIGMDYDPEHFPGNDEITLMTRLLRPEGIGRIMVVGR
jgi:hypothetical protein